MARKRQLLADDPRSPFREFAAYFRELMGTWEARHREAYQYKEAADDLGIEASTQSKIGGGKSLPTPRQCLFIARYFGRPVEEVLRAAGYPDLKRLRQIVADDPTPRDPAVKVRVLGILEMALRPKTKTQPLSWHDVPATNPYRENAEIWLASDFSDWDKALHYADNVYFWYRSEDRSSERQTWKTDEMLAIS